jgi:hypothetical protein
MNSRAANDAENVSEHRDRAPEQFPRKTKTSTTASAPPPAEIRALAAHSRDRVREERANLRRLAHGLAATENVIKRATLAYTLSVSLLRKD